MKGPCPGRTRNARRPSCRCARHAARRCPPGRPCNIAGCGSPRVPSPPPFLGSSPRTLSVCGWPGPETRSRTRSSAMYWSRPVPGPGHPVPRAGATSSPTTTCRPAGAPSASGMSPRSPVPISRGPARWPARAPDARSWPSAVTRAASNSARSFRQTSSESEYTYSYGPTPELSDPRPADRGRTSFSHASSPLPRPGRLPQDRPRQPVRPGPPGQPRGSTAGSGSPLRASSNSSSCAAQHQ